MIPPTPTTARQAIEHINTHTDWIRHTTQNTTIHEHLDEIANHLLTLHWHLGGSLLSGPQSRFDAELAQSVEDTIENLAIDAYMDGAA